MLVALSLAAVSLAALRVSTLPRHAAASATKGVSRTAVILCPAVSAFMTTTTRAATAIPMTPPMLVHADEVIEQLNPESLSC